MANDELISPRTSVVGPSTASERVDLREDEKILIAEERERPSIDARGEPSRNIKRGLAAEHVRFVLWTSINTIATISIVFTNKQIFKDPHLRKNQSTFAAFHFAVTASTLYYASQGTKALFQPQRASLVSMMPLGLAMCLNVILPNLSLAYSSVTFYQIARVLLSPTVAVIHFAAYGVRLPKEAGFCLIPICLGVAMVSYYDTRPRQGTRGVSGETSFAGVIFAISGVVASSLYTVWIETYRKKFEMNSMQLLFNQAPISAFLLLYAIPYTDQMPDWSQVALSKWVLIFFVSGYSSLIGVEAKGKKSGLMAALLNISQFFIVAGAGPVSSTVVGHLKTCSIVALGWMMGKGSTSDSGIFGIFMALTGIVMYSVVMYQHKQRQLREEVEQAAEENANVTSDTASEEAKN